jgi:hypothetical protein
MIVNAFDAVCRFTDRSLLQGFVQRVHWMMWLSGQIRLAELFEMLIQGAGGRAVSCLLQQRGGNFGSAVLAFTVGFTQRVT